MTAVDRNRRCRIACAILLGAYGCGYGGGDSGAPKAVEIENPNRISSPLLTSEVQRSPQPSELLDAEFAIHNRTAAPQAVTLAGKSCACYGVMLDDKPWETKSTITVDPGVPRRLRFDVEPPSVPSEKSWTVRLAIGSDGGREQLLTLGVRIYDDIRLEPEALFVTAPPAAGISDRPPPRSKHAPALQRDDGRFRMMVRRTWRDAAASTRPPRVSGLPAWIRSSTPVAIDEPQEVARGLWQQSWEIHFDLSPSRLQPAGEDSENRASVTDEAADPGTGASPEEPIEEHAAPASAGAIAATQAGVHRFDVEFAGPEGSPIRAAGRIVLEARPGIVAPSVVHWGRVSSDASRNRRIVLSAGDGRPFQIERVRLLGADAPGSVDSPSPVHESSPRPREAAGQLGYEFDSPQMKLTVSLDLEGDGPRRAVALEIAPRQSGALNATLVFETDHPLTPELTVRLRAFVVDGSVPSEVSNGG
ncbi:MAG: hypothetical protein AB7U20_05630 [Planctomycetaceae bacterium]